MHKPFYVMLKICMYVMSQGFYFVHIRTVHLSKPHLHPIFCNENHIRNIFLIRGMEFFYSANCSSIKPQFSMFFNNNNNNNISFITSIHLYVTL